MTFYDKDKAEDFQIRITNYNFLAASLYNIVVLCYVLPKESIEKRN